MHGADPNEEDKAGDAPMIGRIVPRLGTPERYAVASIHKCTELHDFRSS